MTPVRDLAFCVTCGTPAVHRQGTTAWCAEHTPAEHYRSCSGFCTARRRDLMAALAERVFTPPEHFRMKPAPPAALPPIDRQSPKRHDLVATLVAMVRRAAREIPGRASKDVLADLEALLKEHGLS